MTDPTLEQALAYAARGWPVLPCLPGTKIPATPHGHHDATTDPGQITAWFSHRRAQNLAIATGTPGPDVLDIDQHGPARTGYPAYQRLQTAGLTDGAALYIRTPSGGLHAYYTGTTQRNGRLPACHLDFRAAGGYVLAPPSQIGGRPYQLISAPGGHAALDWTAATRLLQPQAAPPPPRQPREDPARDITPLARWVASQPEGNRNDGLFWAANRALENDPHADLDPLADAARQAGLPDPEITRTLNSARRTRSTHPRQPDHQPEAT